MSIPLRVLIADDERPARSLLAALLNSIEDVVVVGEANSGREAVAIIERELPDLVLLDLEMPELDGFGVVRTVKRRLLPLVAFVTAHEKHAVHAFDVNALDYLLKPVEKARLVQTLDRAREWVEFAALTAAQTARRETEGEALAQGDAEPYLSRIPIRKREGILILPVSQIASFVAEGELLHVGTISGEDHTIACRLKNVEARLDPSQFLKLNRGALVRIDLIAKITAVPGGTHIATLTSGHQLTVSRIQSRFLRHRFLRL